MLWSTGKWNQKSCPRVTGAGFEGQCNANEQMWASKPCQLGRRAELTGDKEAGSALLPLNDSAEQKGKTTLWSSWNKAKHEWRLWFIVPVGQYRHVLERLSRGLQTPAEHTALQKASLRDGSEHVWSAGRHTLLHRLVTSGDWSRSSCLGAERSLTACTRGQRSVRPHSRPQQGLKETLGCWLLSISATWWCASWPNVSPFEQNPPRQRPGTLWGFSGPGLVPTSSAPDNGIPRKGLTAHSQLAELGLR